MLLPVYNTTNSMYSCLASEMNSKVAEYMIQTNAYSLIEDLANEINDDCTQRYLDNIIEQVRTTLQQLSDQHFINTAQYEKMGMQPSDVQLDSLFFFLDTRQVSLSIFLSIHIYLFSFGKFF